MAREVTSKDVEKTTSLWKDRENARQYLASVGLSNNLPIFVRFYDGDQWAKATENNKNMPRLISNFIKRFCQLKKSAILSTPVRIVYKSEDDKSAEKFTRFSDYIQKELGQEDLDKRGVGGGVKKGTYIFHYYWDSEARGRKGQLPGGLRCELIDPLNAYFANPTEPDEQKQKWIMFESREEVQAVRAKADKGINPDLITTDEPESPYATKEQEGTPMCTVLTRYFRKDGEVYCEKATKSVVFNAAFPITPNVEAAMREISKSAPYAEEGEKTHEEDPANTSLPDKEGEGKRTITENTKAYLYPVVVGNYEPRENSIYGLGEVEGLINNQKAVNLILSMIVYNVQQTAWSKKIVHPDALRGQRINNDPGQVLYDYSKTGNGIKNLDGQTIPPAAFNIVNQIVDLTRSATGSTEVMTGETVGASAMSGAAIAQLQSQAMLPVEELKDTFWNVKKRQGKVLAQFFKLYYKDEPFTYEEEEDEKDASGAKVMDSFGIPKKKTVRKKDKFSSEEFREQDMDVVVETTAGTKSSAAGDIAALDLLLKAGAISPKTYIEMYPEGALSNKTELVRKLGELEANALASMQQQSAQDQQTIQQLQAIVQQQTDTVNKVYALMNENTRLNAMIAEQKAKYDILEKEANEKLQYANQQIALGNRAIIEKQTDAEALAKDLAEATGFLKG